MSSHDIPHFENDVLIVSPDQARIATALTEEVITDFIDDRFDWPAQDGSEGLNALQRTMTDAGVAIVATKARIVDNGTHLQLTRYLLELDTRGFMVIPELQDLADPTVPEENESVNETLFELGFNQASFQDWSDFIDLLSEGKEFLQTLRSLEQKLGISLGKVASRPVWDDSAEQE